MKKPKISEAELEVMKVLWNNSPQTANEVILVLGEKKEWKPKTVRTLLSRLVQKEAISFHQENGKEYEYYPLLPQEKYYEHETDSFIHRLYGGALKPLIVNFLEREKLSKEEIKELKLILEEQTHEKLNEDER